MTGLRSLIFDQIPTPYHALVEYVSLVGRRLCPLSLLPFLLILPHQSGEQALPPPSTTVSNPILRWKSSITANSTRSVLVGISASSVTAAICRCRSMTSGPKSGCFSISDRSLIVSWIACCGLVAFSGGALTIACQAASSGSTSFEP